MTKKLGWQESTSGPDWMDVIGMMNALSALHSGRVEVIVSLDGIGLSTTVVVTAQITYELLPGSSLPPVVKVARNYPDKDSKTYAAFVYGLLYTLDYEISKTYKNEKLWE